MKISILRHNCDASNLIQQLLHPDSKIESCPFYWKMRGGKSNYGNMYYFTLFGIRVVINTIRKKPSSEMKKCNLEDLK